VHRFRNHAGAGHQRQSAQLAPPFYAGFEHEVRQVVAEEPAHGGNVGVGDHKVAQLRGKAVQGLQVARAVVNDAQHIRNGCAPAAAVQQALYVRRLDGAEGPPAPAFAACGAAVLQVAHDDFVVNGAARLAPGDVHVDAHDGHRQRVQLAGHQRPPV
jgi:hypothetical protein